MIPNDFWKQFRLDRCYDDDSMSFLLYSRDGMVSGTVSVERSASNEEMRAAINKEVPRLYREWWFLKYGGPG